MASLSAFVRPKSRARDEHATHSTSPAGLGSLDAMPLPQETDNIDSSHSDRSRRLRTQGRKKLMGFWGGRSKESGLKQEAGFEYGRADAQKVLAPDSSSGRLKPVSVTHAATGGEEKYRAGSGSEADGLDGGDTTFLAPAPSATRAHRMSRMVGCEGPPLSLAYIQSVKHVTATTPTGSEDSLINAYKAQIVTSSGKFDPSKPDPRAPLSDTAFTTKVYVLTRTGDFFQYSSEGDPDRKPERVLHLNRESAAMACDAVPGKHWVLHVSENFNEHDPATNRMSRFGLPKLGLNARKGSDNFLIVMNSPEDLDSWLTILRREIQTASATDNNKMSPSSSHTTDEQNKDNASRAPSVAHESFEAKVHRTESRVRRKPVGTSSSTNSSISHQRVDSPVAGLDKGSNANAAGVGAQSSMPASSSHYHGEVATQEEPSVLISGSGSDPGRPSSHRSHPSIEAPRSTSLRPRTVAAGHHRSSSNHAPATPPAVADAVTRPATSRRSPSRSLATSHPDAMPNHRKSLTELRNGAGSGVASSEHYQSRSPSPSTHAKASSSPRQSQGHSASSSRNLDSGVEIVSAGPEYRSLNSTSSQLDQSTTVPFSHSISSNLRRIDPDPEQGPVVLTPPDSPRALSAKPTSGAFGGMAHMGEARLMSTNQAKNEIQIIGPNVADLERNPPACPNAVPAQLAVVVPMSTARARPVQVDVAKSPVSHEGVRDSRKRDGSPAAFSILSTEPTGEVAQNKPSLGPGKSGQMNDDLRSLDDSRSSAASIKSMQSATSKLPPRQSSLLHDQGDASRKDSFSTPNSQPSSGRATPASTKKKVKSSASSTKEKESDGGCPIAAATQQIRQKLTVISNSRFLRPSNSQVFTPSPHPAPTGALPALPPVPPNSRSPAGSRPGSRDNRSQNPNAALAAAALSSHSPHDLRGQSQSPKASKNYSDGRNNGIPEIIETTPNQHTRVDRVQLAPMTSVGGVAERRRQRSPSPAATQQEMQIPGDGQDDRLGRKLSLIRENSVRTVGTTKEIEEIEEDMDAESEGPPSSQILPIQSNLTPSSERHAYSSDRDSDYQRGAYYREDSVVEIPIVLQTSAPAPANAFPQRKSSMSATHARQTQGPERPSVLRVNTSGSSRAPASTGSPTVPSGFRINPLASNPIRTPDLQSYQSASHGAKSPQQQYIPYRSPHAPNFSPSVATSSYSASSAASPASKTTSPVVPLSKFSRQAGQTQDFSEFHGNPFSQVVAEDDYSQTRPTFSGISPQSPTGSGPSPANASKSPPIPMQASVTDFSQDDFIWSTPVFTELPETREGSARSSSQHQRFEMGVETPKGERLRPSDDDEFISPKTLPGSESSGSGLSPLGLPGLQLSFGGSNTNSLGAGNTLSVSSGSGGQSLRDPRWSLFGAIENIQ